MSRFLLVAILLLSATVGRAELDALNPSVGGGGAGSGFSQATADTLYHRLDQTTVGRVLLSATNTLCSQALSIAFNGDIDVGVQRSAANTLLLCTNSVAALTLTSTTAVMTGTVSISPAASASDALRITAASGHTGPYLNIRPEDDGSNDLAFDVSPTGVNGSLAITIRPVTAGSVAPILSVGSSGARVMGVTNNNAVFVDTTVVVGGTVTSGAVAAGTGMTIANSAIDDGSTSAGQNMRVASDANASGEIALDVGTNNTATTGTCLRVVTDADGTPVAKLNVECDGSVASTQVTSGTPVTVRLPTAIAASAITLPTCSTSVDAGKMFYVDDSDDAFAGQLCVCAANAAGTYANVAAADGVTACIDP